MATRAEILVFGCCDDDLAVLRRTVGPSGAVLRPVESAAEFARDAVRQRPMALVLGVATRSIAYLDLIPVIHEVRSELPVIVIGEDDSLELERSARERNIFYYLVHPIESEETKAVWKDVQRYAEPRRENDSARR